MEYVNCNLCGSNEYKLFKEINGYRLVKCKRCGLVYLNPRPTQQEMKDKYSVHYYIRQEPKTEEEIEKRDKRKYWKGRGDSKPVW